MCVTNDLSHDQRMHRIASSLQQNGYDVTLVGVARNNSKPLLNNIFKQHRLSSYWSKGKFFYVELNLRLFCYVLLSKVDIVVSNDTDTIMAVYFASLFKNIRRVFDAHELFPEVPELENRPISKAIWRLVEKLLIPRFKVKYTVSESIAHFYNDIYNQKFEVIRNVPNLTTTPMLQSRNRKLILYQGVLNKGRGLEQMIRAMKQLPEYTLCIAGKGDLENDLHQLVLQLQLQKQINFTGALLPEDLKLLTLQAGIGINLLENAGLNYYYSLANKCFDYIHAALPSINMRFPEYEVINNNIAVSVLIDTLDEMEIIQAVKSLEDEKRYTLLKENCFKARELYNWQLEEQKLLKIYAQL